MGSLMKLYRKSLPEMGIAFLFGTLKSLFSRPTVQSTLRAQTRWVLTGSREKPYRDIPEVEICSYRIMELWERGGMRPSTICIDGLPGSGKSSLGRSLAKKAGLEWKTLNWKDLEYPYPFEEGRIYENIRLIRTQDIEHFDLIIYIDCPVDTATCRVMERDRDGIFLDVIDLPKLKEIGDAAFEMIAGEEIRIWQSPARIKFRPADGYRDIENLAHRLEAMGQHVQGFSKEELLFLYCRGKPERGIAPYVKPGAYNRELLSGLSAALRRTKLSRRFS
jgi:hypothetical protein